MRWNYTKSAVLWTLGGFVILLCVDLISGQDPVETHGSVIRSFTLLMMFLPFGALCDLVSWIRERRRQRAYRAVYEGRDLK